MVTTNLGVTKEIISQGPLIVDMECREPDGHSISPKGPYFSLMHSTHHKQQQHPPHSLGPKRKCFFLHEVMSLGIMVIVTLIFKACEPVAKNIS
jgi:hypothetical protein